jgi:hypothetical protein
MIKKFNDSGNNGQRDYGIKRNDISEKILKIYVGKERQCF